MPIYTEFRIIENLCKVSAVFSMISKIVSLKL